MDLGLAGRGYVVTGGSRGIGRAIVSVLLSPLSSYVSGAVVDVARGMGT